MTHNNGGYVNDGTLDYYSYWAWQPTLDWNHAAVQRLWGGSSGILDTWKGLDGFLYDDPTAYLPGGYKTQGFHDTWPTTNKQMVTDPVRARHQGQTFAQFAELYVGDGPPRAEQYGVDLYLADDGAFSRANYLQHALAQEDSKHKESCYWTSDGQCSSVDDVFVGVNGLDAANNHCARTGYCATAWLRLNVTNRIASAAAVNSLQLAMAMSAGYYAAVETVDEASETQWWSPYDYTGAESATVRAVSQAIRSNADALAGNAFRGKIDTDAGSIGFAMLRYDALFTGSFALVAFNFQDEERVMRMDLSYVPLDYLHFLQGGQPTDLLTDAPAAALDATNQGAYPVSVGGRNVTLLGKMQLPAWTSHANRNCWLHRGSTWPTGPQGEHKEEPLQACFLACLSTAECNAVTVEWITSKDDGINLSDQVSCYMRQVASDADVDASCADMDGYHTFTYKWAL